MKFKLTKTGWEQTPKSKPHKKTLWIDHLGQFVFVTRIHEDLYFIEHSCWIPNWTTYEMCFDGTKTDAHDRIPEELVICLGPL